MCTYGLAFYVTHTHSNKDIEHVVHVCASTGVLNTVCDTLEDGSLLLQELSCVCIANLLCSPSSKAVVADMVSVCVHVYKCVCTCVHVYSYVYVCDSVCVCG